MTAAQFKRFRKRHRLTLQAVADHLGVRLPTVWRWDHGWYNPAPVNQAKLVAWEKALDRVAA